MNEQLSINKSEELGRLYGADCSGKTVPIPIITISQTQCGFKDIVPHGVE